MSKQLLFAILGILLFVASFPLYCFLRKKNPGLLFLAFLSWAIGLAVFFIFGTLWMREVYSQDDVTLATWSMVFLGIGLLMAASYLPLQKAPKWVSSIALAILFLALIAFLIIMICLSRTAILNGNVPSTSSSELSLSY